MAKYKKGKSEPFWRKTAFWGWLIPVLFTIIALYLAYPSFVADSRENEERKAQEKITTPFAPLPDPCGFPSEFDSTNLYILITRFEDNVNTGFETKCYGYSILSRLDQIKNDSNLRIKICYVDKDPPKQSDDAIRLRDQYRADVIIWGKLRDAEPDCQAGGFCIKFQPSDTLVRYAGGKLSPKVDNEYQPNVSDRDLEEGLIKMGDVSFTAWILSMWNLKIGRKKPGFYKVAFDLSAEKQAEEYAIRANLFFKFGLFEKTIQDYNQAIRLKPSYVLYYKRGITYAKLSQHEKAIKDFDKAAELKSDDANIYYNRGKSKGFLNRGGEAIADYNIAIQLDSNFASAYNILGLIKNRLGQSEAAIAYLEKAIQLDPDNAITYNNRGSVRDELGQYESAIVDYDKAIQLDSKNANAYGNRASTKNNLGQYKEAITDCNIAIQLDSNNINAFNNRGFAMIKLGQYKAAIIDYDKAIQLDPKNVVGYNNRGTAKNYLNQYEAAIADFDKSIQLDPNDATSYNERAGVKIKLGQYNLAIADFDTALQLDPKNLIAYAYRGIAYTKLGRYKVALNDFDKVIKLEPNAVIFYERGVAKSGLGRYKEAIADFNNAIKINPNNIDAYKNRGNTYWRQGKYTAAFKDFYQTMRLRYLPGWKYYVLWILITIGLFAFWWLKKRKRTFSQKRKQITVKKITRQKKGNSSGRKKSN